MSHSQEIEDSKEKDPGENRQNRKRLKRRRKTGQKKKKQKSRAERKKERTNKKIRSLILEVSFYVAFLVLLFTTAMNNRDPVAFGYRTSVMTYINVNNSVEKIQTIPQFWKWVNVILLPFLYPQTNWAGKNVNVHPKMVANFASYRVGPLRLRQHRVPNEPCTLHSKFEKSNMRCVQSWWISRRDSKHYERGWKPSENVTEIVPDGHVWSEWEYRPWSSIGGTPLMGEIGTYPPGGYVIDIAGDVRAVNQTLRRLRKEAWLDMRTRFLIIEMTLYCPHVNFFAMVPVMFEFPQAEVFMGKAHMYPFRLFSYLDHYPLSQFVSDALVYAAITWFLVREFFKMKEKKCKYFKSVWNILELVNLLLSLGVVALYLGRHIVTSHVTKQVKRAKGQFYNFQTLAIWDELFGILLGFVCFLSTMQILHLLRFNRRMSIFAATLREASGDLSAFFLVFGLVYIAFVSFCFIMFGQVLVDFSSVPRSLETLVTVALGDFNYKALNQVNRIFAPTFLFLYMTTMIFVLLNMLITILNDSFAVVREDVNRQPNDHELIDFILDGIPNCSLRQYYPWRYICATNKKVDISVSSSSAKVRSSSSSPGLEDRPVFKTRSSSIPLYDGLDLIELNDDGSIRKQPTSKICGKTEPPKGADFLSDSFILMDECQLDADDSPSRKEQEVPDFSLLHRNITQRDEDNDDSCVPSLPKY